MDFSHPGRWSASLSGESRPRYQQNAPTATCVNSGTDHCQGIRKKLAVLPVRKATTIKYSEQLGNSKNKSINEIELFLLVLQSVLCNLTVKGHKHAQYLSGRDFA